MHSFSCCGTGKQNVLCSKCSYDIEAQTSCPMGSGYDSLQLQNETKKQKKDVSDFNTMDHNNNPWPLCQDKSVAGNIKGEMGHDHGQL